MVLEREILLEKYCSTKYINDLNAGVKSKKQISNIITIINLFFAGTLGLGLFLDKLFLKTKLDSAIHISDTGWRILTRLWIFFFLFLAALNELARRMLSTDNWVNFKVFGILAFTLIFSLAIIPIIKSHAIKQEKDS